MKTDPKAEKTDTRGEPAKADPPARRRRTPAAAAPAAPAPPARPPERVLTGLAVSPGVAIGPAASAAQARVEAPRHEVAAEAVEAEIARFDEALALSRKQIHKLKARLPTLPEEAKHELEPLLDAYLQMLTGSRLVRAVRKRIAETRANAEAAVEAEVESFAAALTAIAGGGDAGGLKRRIDEVKEIGSRLVRNLTRTPWRSLAGLPQGAVLVAEQITPADAALLDPARLAGAVAEQGGTEGHAAIMLRSLGLPAVLGVAGLAAAAQPGSTLVVDGGAGTVTVNPAPATLAAARKAVADYARQRQKLAKLRRLPAVTRDGEAVELQANMELPLELPLIAQAGAQGIGLLRSEFLFMNRETLPDEDEQAETFSSVVEAMAGDPVTIRVLDWGGEKQIEALSARGDAPTPKGQNPALGVRGLRLLLRREDLFETQLAAALRAAMRGPVRILLPMVTTPAEVRAAREIYERVVRRLKRRGLALPEPLPPLGIMIETPGAALAADALALEADFFAIGTNDLAMYALAVDRAETDVAHLYDPLHPAVLRLVQFATEAALRLRMPVSVCGESAGDPRLTPLLLGLGVRSLSMGAGSIPRVKQMVRSMTIDDAARLARRVMESSDPGRIAELVAGFALEG